MEAKSKNIHGFDNYLIFEDGRVLSLERFVNQKNGSKKLVRSRFLKPRSNSKGYLSVILYKSRYEYKSFRLHRLVYEAFHGEIPEGMEINHINADKKDNKLSNLELVTRNENMQHAKKMGLIKRKVGSENHFSIFIEDEVKRVRYLYSKGMSKKDLSLHFCVNYSTIDRIVKRITWKHI